MECWLLTLMSDRIFVLGLQLWILIDGWMCDDGGRFFRPIVYLIVYLFNRFFVDHS